MEKFLINKICHKKTKNITQASPFCRISVLPDDSVTLNGYSAEVEFIRELSRIFNFKIEFVNSHQIWGKFLNGTYVGLLGHVANRVRKCF